MWKCSSYAGMMELVDMRDLGSRAVMRWGSSPHARTNYKKEGKMADKMYNLCLLYTSRCV